jgi:hypothetical protein
MAKEQAKRDAEAAREQQKLEAEAARQQALAAKKQVKADKQPQTVAQRQVVEVKPEVNSEQERQRALDAAAERLRAAEEEYQAELARRSQR